VPASDRCTDREKLITNTAVHKPCAVKIKSNLVNAAKQQLQFLAAIFLTFQFHLHFSTFSVVKHHRTAKQ